MKSFALLSSISPSCLLPQPTIAFKESASKLMSTDNKEKIEKQKCYLKNFTILRCSPLTHSRHCYLRKKAQNRIKLWTRQNDTRDHV